MTIFLTDGFETNDFSKWTGQGAIASIISTTSHSGIYCCYNNAGDSTWGPTYLTLGGESLVYFRAYVKFVSDTLDGAVWDANNFMDFYGAGNVDIAHAVLSKTPAGTYRWGYTYANGAGYTQAFGVGTWTMDRTRWYLIEMAIFIDGAAGWAKLWVDEVLTVDSGAGVDTNNYGNVTMVSFGAWTTHAYEFDVDDASITNFYNGPLTPSLATVLTCLWKP